MRVPSGGHQGWSLSQAVSKWCSAWTPAPSASSEPAYPDDDIERLAKDVAVSVPELRALVRRGPEAANLLLRRMAALNLDCAEVSRTERRTFQDLQRVCTMCGSKRRCRRDLSRRPASPDWENYCPNSGTLKALDAMPWASRREW